MAATNYKNSMTVPASPAAVFSALTTGIAVWWSEDYNGAAAKVGDEFTVRFTGRNTISMRITELVPNKKITWLCTDFYIDVPVELEDKKEWIGTKVIWEISKEGDSTKLDMVHEGLTPVFECWQFCEGGWNRYVGSLKNVLEGGIGVGHKAA